MFKLLALRVLDGCAMHIKKCLRNNVFYYFCADYRFDIHGKIYKGSKYTRPLQDDFFLLPISDYLEKPKDSPTININAIVGKNGDGKSTIVEIIIRLVNNYIARKQKKGNSISNQELIPIPSVCAELYFIHGNAIYKLYAMRNNKCGIRKLADINTFWANTAAQYLNIDRKLNDSDILQSIYTFVSNYSHYAYNVYDFRLEWDMKRPHYTEEEQNEACWLYHIFHKSDSYLTPLALHPYRKSGNLDINREKSLSEQRLMSLFINANDKPSSFRYILDGKAVSLKFSDPQYSKLQDITLKQFLNSTWVEDTCLDDAIDAIESLKKMKINTKNYAPILRKLKSDTLVYIQNLFDTLTGLGNSTDLQYKQFMVQMNDYVRKNIPLCFAHKKHGQYDAQQSNIAKYIHDLHHIQLYLKRMNISYNSTEPYLQTKIMLNRYSRYVAYNVVQLARMRLIYQVARLHNIDPFLIFEDYKNLSEYQKCEHYIIYKTISIMHKYPSYMRLIQVHRPYSVGPYEATEDELNKIYKLLHDDMIAESHITRKLDQAFRYLINKENIKSDYYKDRLPHVDRDPDPTSQSISHSFIISLDTLKGRKKRLKLCELPPPIYEYEIMFEYDEHILTGMTMLSSGEKQLLHTIGAFIYHIQNIESTRKYDSINLILEEIELYFHPEYQRLFLHRLIQQIHGAELKNIKNVNITLVTHSPFILSDIPKCNVLFLKEGKQDYGMQENTFGANIHSLLKNGFFLPNLPMGEFAYQKINELFRQLNSSDYDHSEENISRIKQEIALIGEPYLRDQLYRLLPNK